MACNCIEEREDDFRKKTGDEDAFLSTIYDLENGMRRFNCKAFFHGKKERHRKSNFEKCFIAFDYCPFCGKKYIEEV